MRRELPLLPRHAARHGGSRLGWQGALPNPADPRAAVRAADVSLALGVALFGRGNQRGAEDLPRHGM
jgi:hypothetical protein